MKTDFLYCKRFIACLAAFAVMLSAVAVSGNIPFRLTASAEETASWNGSIAKPDGADSKGNNSEDPVEITSAAELAWLVNQTKDATKGKYYKLTADIVLNDTSAEDWQENAKPWFAQNAAANNEIFFAGHFNGGGHTVSGLYFGDKLNDGQKDLAYWSLSVGLFPNLATGASVEALGIINSQITAVDICKDKGDVYAGLIAGYGYCPTDYENTAIEISNCFADETASVTSKSIAGGLVGYVQDCSLNAKNSYSSAEYPQKDGNGNGTVGGIIGSVWQATFTAENCYSVHARLTKEIYNASTINYTNCYTTSAAVGAADPAGVKQLGTDEMIGSAAIEKMGLDSSLWGVNGNTLPYLKSIFTSYVPKVSGEPAYWDGSMSKPAGADSKGGSADNAIEIKNAAELAWLVNQTTAATSGKYYKLTADIKINDTSAENWQANAKPWFAQNAAQNNEVFFAGHFDGNGHIISGLYFGDSLNSQQSSLAYWSLSVGLFPNMATGASVKNLGIINSQITAVDICEGKGDAYAGLIAGFVYCPENYGNQAAVEISNCFADESDAVTAKNNAGGLVGYVQNYSLTAKNSYSSASFPQKDGKGNASTGGIIGAVWSATFTAESCYSVHARLTKEAYNASTLTYTNCYTTHSPAEGTDASLDVKQFNLDEMTGRASVGKMKLSTDIWAATANSRPYLKGIFAGYIPPEEFLSGNDGVKGEPWSGNIASKFAGGDGRTAETAFEIETPEQLARLVNSSKDDTAGRYYKLTADIIINDTSAANWQASAISWFAQNDAENAMTFFAGHFDGQGHTVSGLYFGDKLNTLQSSLAYWSLAVGLFPTIAGGADIKNVGIVNSEINAVNICKNKGEVAAGFIAGSGYSTAQNPIEISGCFADETAKISSANFAGGIIGKFASNSYMSIDHCYFTGTVSGAENTAMGIIGIHSTNNNGLKMLECYSIGSKPVRDDMYIQDTILYCYSDVRCNKGGITYLTADDMKGSAAKEKMYYLDWDNYWKTNENGTPSLKALIPEDYSLTSNGTANAAWSGKPAATYAGGDGSESNPYLIATPEQLTLLMSDSMNSESATLNKYYKLTENIHLNNTSNPNWKNTAKRWFTLISVRATNQCSFKGNFDGDGHIVRGLYIKYERPEYEEDENYAALFPVIGKTANVRGVGLDESEIDSTGSGFIGGIVGYITYWDTEDENEDKNVYTHITECFGSKTVVIKGKCVGGILGASPSPLYAKDCYFIGQLTPDEQSTKPGGIIGNTWTPLDFKAVVENCYVATPNGDKIVGSRNRDVRNINAYTTVLDYDGASTLSLLRMKGETAKTNMKGFDFKNVWKTVSAGTPVLRIFNSERYTNTDEPQKVEISFATNGGNEVEAIYGYDGDKIDWPTVTRYGYRLVGWHVFPELDCLYNSDVFPMRDTVLYAEWESIGFVQDFEEYEYGFSGLGSDYEQYRPGVLDYNVDYVRGGINSIHRIGDSADEQDFLLFGDEIGYLIEGRTYELTFYITTDQANAKATLSLVQHNFTDLEDDIESCDIMETVSLNQGEWTKVTYRFKDKGYYLRIRSTGNASLFFDDVLVVPLDNAGNISYNVPVTGENADTLVASIAVMAASLFVLVLLQSKVIKSKNK